MKKELTLKELQHVGLEMLKEVHAFCVREGLMYSVAYGTLIGTIRHKGFIPWDDDIDIVMPRPDYDRFCRTFHSERFRFKSPETDKDLMLAFARVYDDTDTVLDTLQPWCMAQTGVYIDVFPLDSVPDNPAFMGLELYANALAAWKRSNTARTALGPFRKEKPLLFNVKLLAKKILYFGGRRARFYIDRIIDCQHAIPWGGTAHWGQLGCLDSVDWHSMDTFTSASLFPFEDTEVMVMNGYDQVLREYYGDYMELPPVEERVPKGNTVRSFYWK